MKHKTGVKKAIFVTFNRLGCACLKEIVSSGLVEVRQVYTLKPEFARRISDYQDITPFCRKFRLPLKKIRNINDNLKEITAIRPDIIFVIGWSQILKKELLNLPSIGCIGFHPAMLPRNRGRAAIAWHFINEEKFGGATIFFLDEGCDSGDIIGQVKFVLTDKDDAKTYYRKAESLAVEILHRSLTKLLNGSLKARKQNHQKANYLLIRNTQDSYLDFYALNTRQIFNQVRAVAYVYPAAFAFYDKRKVEFLTAAMVPKKHYIYSATPGQIIQVFPKSVWVKTVDGIIELGDLSVNGKQLVNPLSFFKVGHHLNR